MSVYTAHLPGAFIYAFKLPRELVAEMAKVLLDSDMYDNGSSFAVTADAMPGHNFLWLSNASYQLLEREGFFLSDPE